MTACLSGVAGCSPSAAAAKPPAPAPVEPAKSPQPIPKPENAQDSEPKESPPDAPDYRLSLSFKARANPFAKVEPGPQDRTAGRANSGPIKVELTGLMNSASGAMAAVIVDGQKRIVQAGARFQFASGAAEMRIVEIRASDIVVEQNGRQWVESLPRP